MAARRRACALLASALLLMQSAAGAGALPVVTWVTPELSNDTNNFGDHYLSFLMGRLPGFEHRVVHGSVGRVWHDIQTSHNSCVFNALKTAERQSFSIYSRRPMLTPAYRLFFPEQGREALAPYLDGDGRVELTKLVASSLRGAITANRAYNPVIDSFIAARRKSRPLEGVVSNRQLLALLGSGRLDFAFVSPIDIEGSPDGLADAPIRGAEVPNASFVVCSKGKTGEAVIAAVDHLFEDQEAWADFIEPMRAVLSPEDYQASLHTKP